MLAIGEQVVNSANEHSQLHRRYQYVAGLLGRVRIFEGEWDAVCLFPRKVVEGKSYLEVRVGLLPIRWVSAYAANQDRFQALSVETILERLGVSRLLLKLVHPFKRRTLKEQMLFVCKGKRDATQIIYGKRSNTRLCG
ncbi:hypothetical protein EVAR_17703_1 [Eumeta japonica]|uniref:Uncharacterized protein n=1 Tax=Eumeta variegata TaxID=151549 RepID=A0A4C1URT2_EUMVA|nr:hypothetical protein EVAR_17703_1 [Eumeta japonica]